MLLAEGEYIHVCGVEYELRFKIISRAPCIEYHPDDAVDHVAVGEEAEAEAEQRVDGLLGVVGGDIAVTYDADRVYTPVQTVEVSTRPPEL